MLGFKRARIDPILCVRVTAAGAGDGAPAEGAEACCSAVNRSTLGIVADRPDVLVALLRALREETGCADVAYADAPSRIASGHAAVVDALQLVRGPAGFDGPLIARCFEPRTPPRAASLEAAVHEGLAERDRLRASGQAAAEGPGSSRSASPRMGDADREPGVAQ